jgi:tRNA(Ile)-lysidine synthase
LSSGLIHSLTETLQTELQTLPDYTASDPLLVGFSGGMDSTVLLHALHTMGLPVAAAHVNYTLRGEESEQDAVFCREFCAERQIPFHLYTVDAQDFLPGLSVQVNARNIRYAWFDQVCTQFHYKRILTGHHLDDQVETAVMQWLRRKQADIWHPIPEVNRNIFRPFLKIPRQRLDAYATENSIEYRHDSSNDEDAYLRNRIRNHIIPELKAVQPSLLSHMQERLSLYASQYTMASQWLDLQLKTCLQEEGDVMRIHVQKFDDAFGAQSEAALHMLMTRWHEPFGIVGEVLKIWNADSGKQVSGMHAQYIKDRGYLCKVPFRTSPEMGFIRPGDTELEWNHFRFSIRTFPYTPGYVPPDHPWVLTMDAARLKWPLKLRVRKTGDTMKPLGMQGNKKVSDILTDMKMPADQKQQAYVLESANAVIYVQDFRISSQVRLSKNTKHVVQIHITPLTA